MEHRELLELTMMLPLGTLSPQEEAQVLAHLAEGCAECAGALRKGAFAVDALVQTVPPLDPGPTVRARLLAQAARSRGPGAASPPARRSRILSGLGRLALAAGLLAALLLGLERLRLGRALDAERALRAQAEQLLAAAADERERLAHERDALRHTVDDLTARQTRVVELAGAGPAAQASARAYLDTETRRLVLVVYDLPPLPPGRSYQLWVIRAGEPESAGVFGIEAGGTARYTPASVPSLEGAVTIAVTIEPEGGLPKPSGPVVLAGS